MNWWHWKLKHCRQVHTVWHCKEVHIHAMNMMEQVFQENMPPGHLQFLRNAGLHKRDSMKCASSTDCIHIADLYRTHPDW